VPSLADPLVQAYAADYAGEPEPYHLALWHGWSAALLLSALTLGGSALLFLRRDPFRALQRRAHTVLGRLDADRSYDAAVRGVDHVALRSTAVVQTGSLPVYLGTVLLTLVLLPGVALVAQTSVSGDLRAYDNPLQLVRRRRHRGGCRRHRARPPALHRGAVPRARSATASPCCSWCRAVPTSRSRSSSSRPSRWSSSCSCCAGCPSHFTRRRLRLSQTGRLAVALAWAPS
jgi:hypothetical protein